MPIAQAFVICSPAFLVATSFSASICRSLLLVVVSATSPWGSPIAALSASALMSVAFNQLSQQEQAAAISPAHAFPVMTVGKAIDSSDVLVSAKLPALKKEVHRIPANSGLLRSFSMFWPVLTASLPATSVATLKKGLPAVNFESWMEIVAWLLSVWPTWSDDQKIIFQAEVAEEVPDVDVGRWLASLTQEAFLCSFLCEIKEKEKEKDRPKMKVLPILLWWSIYSWVSKTRGKEVICALRLDDDFNIKDTPLSIDDWVKLLKAVGPQMTAQNTFEKLVGTCEISPAPAPVDSWRLLLQPHSEVLGCIDIFTWFAFFS